MLAGGWNTNTVLARKHDGGHSVATQPHAFLDDLPMRGPRTTLWCCRQVAETGPDITPRYDARWYENNIKVEQKGAEQHETFGEVLGLAVEYRQLDISNLACLSGLARTDAAVSRLRFEEVEERQRHEDKRDGNGSARLLGQGGTVGKNLVSPDFKNKAADRVRGKAVIVMEQGKPQEAGRHLRENIKGNRE